MSIYTVIGDPHAKKVNLEQIGILFEIIEGLGNDTIILGDLLDNKELIYGSCLNLIHEKLKYSKVHFDILIGNHDWFNLECKEHSLETLGDLENVSLISAPVVINDMGFMPYYHNKEQFRTDLREVNGCKILFMHQDVMGFDYGDGYISDDGIEISELSRFPKIVSGHFHKFQQSGNLTYLGTSFSHSFGESNQDKYISLYNSETGELNLLRTSFPAHVTLEVDCDSPIIGLNSYRDNDYVRVIFHGKKENINRVKAEYPHLLKFKNIEKSTDLFQASETIKETLDNVGQFKFWADKIKNLDEATTKLGIEILKEVSK